MTSPTTQPTIADVGPPHDPHTEAAVLSIVLSVNGVMASLLGDVGLRPQHFYWPRHEQTFTAMVGLHDRDAGIDEITLKGELERLGFPADASEIAGLQGPVPLAANLAQYAERVVELAEWRKRLRAAQDMVAAVGKRDQGAWAQAELVLEGPTTRSRGSYTPDAAKRAVISYLERDDNDDFIPMPFYELTQAMDGGLRPGEVMAVAGWTNHGKSIYTDMIADLAAKHGRRVHLYMTEMTAAQRGLRWLARRGLPFGKLRRREMDDALWKRVMGELDQLTYGWSIVSDWSIDDVCRDIRRARWDLAIIDVLHDFPYDNERELTHLIGSVRNTATASSTDGHDGTAIIPVCHLNDGQVRDRQSPAMPHPGLHSLKGASSIKQKVDLVQFVFQEGDEETGLPTGEGEVWIAKGRNQGTAHVDVVLNPARMRFELKGQE